VRRRTAVLVTLCILLTPSLALAAPNDVKVSDQAYVRYDGGTDATLAACSVNNRQQNEPAASVAPHNESLMTAGANDYCTVPTTTDAWAGSTTDRPQSGSSPQRSQDAVSGCRAANSSGRRAPWPGRDVGG